MKDQQVEKLVDKIKSLPQTDVYVLDGELTREEVVWLSNTWDNVQKQLGRPIFLINLPREVSIRASSREEVKQTLTEILERL